MDLEIPSWSNAVLYRMDLQIPSWSNANLHQIDLQIQILIYTRWVYKFLDDRMLIYTLQIPTWSNAILFAYKPKMYGLTMQCTCNHKHEGDTARHIKHNKQIASYTKS